MRYSYLLLLVLFACMLVLVFRGYQKRPGVQTVEAKQSQVEANQRVTTSAIKPLRLAAVLENPEQQSLNKTMTVLVKVTGADLDKDAHIHYRINEGVIIGTSATRLNFYDLPSGTNSVKLSLVDQNHKPLGPEETLIIDIP